MFRQPYAGKVPDKAGAGTKGTKKHEGHEDTLVELKRE